MESFTIRATARAAGGLWLTALALMLATMLPTTGLAQNEITLDGITYTLDAPNAGEATVKDCDETKVGAVTIPATVEAEGVPYRVTTIGKNAFRDCWGPTSISIPQGVTTIGSYAFSGCWGLTRVTIPEGVTTIGSNAFSGCTRLTKVTIPEGVTTIGSNAFSGCTGLTSVTIPAGVTRVENYAFDKCIGLTSLTISQGVTEIGQGAFRECTGLKSVILPRSVTTIESSAFSGCSGLTSLTISQGVTEIGQGAFIGCTGLTSVTIPEGIKKIGDSAFKNCTGLESVTLPEGVTRIEKYAFEECTRLATIYSLSSKPPETYQWTFMRVSKPCMVYVPAGSVDAYKAAEGWKTLTVKALLQPAKVTMTTTKQEVLVGESITLTAKVEPEGAAPTVLWTIDSEEFATIDAATGVLTGVKVGQVQVTATSAVAPSLLVMAAITVCPAPTGVTIATPTTEVTVEQPHQLTAKVEPEEADQRVTWSVDNEEFATIDAATGVLTGVKVGQVQVTATSVADGRVKSNPVTITVKLPAPTSVTITNAPTEWTQGPEYITLEARVEPERADQTVTWSVDNPEIADIDAESGQLWGRKVGQVQVTATSKADPAMRGTVAIKILPYPTKVTIIAPATEVTAGQTLQLSVKVEPEEASQSVSWYVNSYDATIDPNGLLTAKMPGWVQVRVLSSADRTLEATVFIRVLPRPTEVFITSTEQEIFVRESITLTAKVEPEGADQSVTWSVDNEEFATIDAGTGVLSGVKVGQVQVTATNKVDLTKKATVIIAVKMRPAPTAVTITYAPTEVTVGQTHQLTAQVEPNEADQRVIWSVDNEGLATIDAKGGFTAKKAGEVQVTATSVADPSMGETLTIKVLPRPTDVFITSTGQEVFVGESITLTAKVEPEGADQWVFWHVDNEEFATIDEATGTLTGVKVGWVQVTATNKVDHTKKATVFIAVKMRPAPTGVVITSPEREVAVGATLQLEATVVPEGADQRVSWSVNKPELGVVDAASGLLTALKAGTVVVIATSVADPSKTAMEVVTVKVEESNPVPSTDLSWRVAVDGLTLVIMEAEGQTLELYNLAGAKLHRVDRVDASPYRVAVPQAGLYILRVGNSSRKMVVQ